MSLARLLTTAALGALALALPAHTATTGNETVLTIRLTAATAYLDNGDLAPRGQSRGDFLLWQSVLRNAVPQFGRPRGAVVGRAYARVTVWSATGATAHVLAYLPGGTLEAEGRTKVDGTPHHGTIPVVGGTGRYAHAHGTASARALDRHRSLTVYHLQLP